MGLTALEAVAIPLAVLGVFCFEEGWSKWRGYQRAACWLASFLLWLVAVVLVMISVQGP